jgi:cytochrome c551/c552
VQRVNGDEVTGHENPTVIHCFTCHSPHSSGDFGLRWTDNVELQNGTVFDLGAGNLCAACHQSRRDVSTYVGTVGTDPVTISSTHWGPHHGPQSDMLVGSNGYEYAGYAYNQSSHRAAVEDGCVGCHQKGATSNNVVGGHTWNMRGLIRDLGGDTEEILNTGACLPCHDVDDFDVGGTQTDIVGLAEELESLVEAAGLWEDGHPMAGVSTSVDSAGAVWNLLMVEEDRSMGVHNPKYAEALLESAIQFLEPGPDPMP